MPSSQCSRAENALTTMSPYQPVSSRAVSLGSKMVATASENCARANRLQSDFNALTFDPTRLTPSFFSARAANGQITAPPTSVMNAHLFIRSPSRRRRAAYRAARGQQVHRSSLTIPPPSLPLPRLPLVLLVTLSPATTACPPCVTFTC